MLDDWRYQASCRNATDPEIFDEALPTGRRAINDTYVHPAVAKYCNFCPVKQECLDFAMQFDLSDRAYGIFGGLTANQRIRLRRNNYPSAQQRKKVS